VREINARIPIKNPHRRIHAIPFVSRERNRFTERRRNSITVMTNVAHDEAIAGNGEIQRSGSHAFPDDATGTAPGAASDAGMKNLCFAKRRWNRSEKSGLITGIPILTGDRRILPHCMKKP
jgi:hypothetical protein